MNRNTLLILSIALLTACSEQHSQTEVSPCGAALNFKDGKCFCGPKGLSPEDAKQWQCIDNTHFLCLKNTGCAIGDLIYPIWSALGDRAGSMDAKIPAQPKNPKGYKLEYDSWHEVYQWECVDRDCACGKGMLHGYAGHEVCTDETFKAKPQRDCGDEICMIDGVCRDGKCWCGDTWQGTEGAKYQCVRHQVPGEDVFEQFKSGYKDAGIKPEQRCDGAPEFCDYIRDEIQNSKDIEYDYICNDKKGCACGNATCPFETVCRQEHCYCGDIDITHFEDRDNYLCDKVGLQSQMLCVSKNGCKCGDHRVVQDATCIDGKQYCKTAQQDWIEASVISKYRCAEHDPMIVCNDPKGCACGKNTCINGASCIDGNCVCGDSYQTSQDILSHKEQYICRDGLYVCNSDSGCDCDLDVKCTKGAECIKDKCICGKDENATIEQHEQYECSHDIDYDDAPVYTCNSENCLCQFGENEQEKCYRGDVCGEYGCLNSTSKTSSPENADLHIGNKQFNAQTESYNGNINILMCSDCNDFTLYEIEYEGSCRDVSQTFFCKKNGGCMHEGRHYDYNTELSDTDGVRYSGFPNIKSSTPKNGDAVPVCGHIYPYGALLSYLQSGTISEIRDTWVCDKDECTCGAKTCHAGDLCQNGKCTPYKGCSPKESFDTIVRYCHTAGQMPEILPDYANNEHYICQARGSSKDKHWYCTEDACPCGENTCSLGSYCQNGQCMCEGKPLQNGFVCTDGKAECASASCNCGNEPLREGYRCVDDRQLCMKQEGCICGNRITAYKDVCDHDVDVCNPFVLGGLNSRRDHISVSRHEGCLCGDVPLPPKSHCTEGKVVCESDACSCGNAVCGMGDVCDHGVCKCREKTNKGCLCGNDVVTDPEHYQCIDGLLVCVSKEVGDPNHYPKDLPACTCGSEQIRFGAVCKNNQLCKDCPYVKYAVYDGQFFHKMCDWNGSKVDIAYHYVADCYPSDDGYICEDDREYYHIMTLDPCDCLYEDDAPQTKEALADYYCSITQEMVHDCSDRVPKESVAGWFSIESEAINPYKDDNPCIQAGSTNNFGHRHHTINHTCLCGKYEIPDQDAEKYYCDMELTWRCNDEKGCPCGEVSCAKSQICLKPGVCSL